jgi:transposase-like protein
MLVQTDLYSFSFKLGTLVPWCKNCGCEKFHKDGQAKNGKQRYECVRCGFRFVWTSDFPRRNFFSNVISFAVELYTTLGVSLRSIAKKFYKFFKIKVCHETIRQWVLAGKKFGFSVEKNIESRVWHIDETHIRIKGSGFWLWVVLCGETKKVIAWHISKKRLYKEAKTVLEKALQRTRIKPTKIITDGLWQYQAAIKRVLGLPWNIYKQIHIVDSGIGKNAAIERLNKEVKRRIKWFSTFQALEGAEAFFNVFFYHYNQLKPT